MNGHDCLAPKKLEGLFHLLALCTQPARRYLLIRPQRAERRRWTESVRSSPRCVKFLDYGVADSRDVKRLKKLLKKLENRLGGGGGGGGIGGDGGDNGGGGDGGGKGGGDEGGGDDGGGGGDLHPRRHRLEFVSPPILVARHSLCDTPSTLDTIVRVRVHASFDVSSSLEIARDVATSRDTAKTAARAVALCESSSGQQGHVSVHSDQSESTHRLSAGGNEISTYRFRDIVPLRLLSSSSFSTISFMRHMIGSSAGKTLTWKVFETVPSSPPPKPKESCWPPKTAVSHTFEDLCTIPPLLRS